MNSSSSMRMTKFWRPQWILLRMLITRSVLANQQVLIMSQYECNAIGSLVLSLGTMQSTPYFETFEGAWSVKCASLWCSNVGRDIAFARIIRILSKRQAIVNQMADTRRVGVSEWFVPNRWRSRSPSSFREFTRDELVDKGTFKHSHWPHANMPWGYAQSTGSRDNSQTRH